MRAAFDAITSRLTPAVTQRSGSEAGVGSVHGTVNIEDEEKSDRYSDEVEVRCSGEFNEAAEPPRTQRLLYENSDDEDMLTDPRGVSHGSQRLLHTEILNLGEKVTDSESAIQGSESQRFQRFTYTRIFNGN
jgi:hypothetical protein